MSALTIIATILYTLVALTLIGNFIRLIVETKKLKENKQTPLVGKTIATVIVATIAEIVILVILLKVVAILNIVSGLVSTVIVFTLLFYIRQMAAYLATWGLWAVFVNKARKQELTKIQQDLKNGAGQ